MLSDTVILTHIARQPKRQAGYKQLIRELGLHGEERRNLNDHLQKLVKRGALIPLDSDRYQLPQAAADKNLIAGRLSMHRDGFGFVIPDPKSLSGPLKSKLAGDIFIAPHQIGTAMHGDQVLVEIANVRPDGRAEGRIVRTVNRAHSTVVGIFHYSSRRNYVTPIDTKITQEIVIPEGMELPVSSVTSVPPVVKDLENSPKRTQRAQRKKHSVDRVLGEEAARHADYTNLEGVVVDVEITDWPSATQSPRGKVVEILGREDDFGVDVEIIIRKFHLPHHFPAATLEEAQQVPAPIPGTELRHRRDFRSLPIVTIDGETARDFDDAIHVCMLPSHNFELQVPAIISSSRSISPTSLNTSRPTPPSIRKPVSAAPASTSPTAPSRCSRSNSPRISAAFARKLTGSSSPASWKSTTAVRS